MMKKFLCYKEACTKLFIYFLFVMFLGVVNIGTAYAQYPVKINVQVRQPVSPYLPQILGELQERQSGAMTRDITDRLHITLQNSGNSPKHLKLSGKLERLSPAPMSISLRPGFAPPTPIIMNPGQMIQANRELLNLSFGGFNQSDLIFNNTGLSELRQNSMNYKLPEGTYRICFSAFDYDKSGMTGPLSAPGTGCAIFVICYSASAPQLIMPVSTMGFNNNDFEPFTPHSSQVQFTWTPPASTCGLPIRALTYNLSIRRVFPGQTIKDALFNPPVFQKENIHSTTFLLDTIRYPHVLRTNEQYIFRVKANMLKTPNNPLEIDNQGFSQIGAFAFNPQSVSEKGNQLIVSNKDTLQKRETTIKGKLSYLFGDDLESGVFPLANQKVYIKRVYTKASKDADGVTHFVPLTEAEQNSMPPYPEILDGQLTETDEEGRFKLKVGMTNMDDAGVLEGDQWKNLFTVQNDNNEQFIPENAIPSIPDPLKGLEGQMVRLYKLEIVNPHFKPSEKYIQISPGGEIDLREVVVEANSYTLKVNVREVVAALRSTIFTRTVEEMKGDFAGNATVTLYRLTRNKKNLNLSIPYFEGDLLKKSDWQEEGDKVLIASRTTPNPDSKTDNPEDYEVSFPRLFRNSEGELYDYIVCLSNGKGTLRLPNNNDVINDPPVPQNSGYWKTVDDMNYGNPDILEHGNHPSRAAEHKMPNEIQPIRGGNNPLQNGKQPLPKTKSPIQPKNPVVPPRGIPGHGPYAEDPFLYSLPVEKDWSDSVPLAPHADDSGSIGLKDYENKWSSWSYNGTSDVAYLTLEKELAEPPHSVVTGKLEYKYKGDPSIPAQPYANMPVKLMMFYIEKDKTQPQTLNLENSDNASGAVQPYAHLENSGYYSAVVQTYANQDLPEGYDVDVPTDQHSNGGDRTFFDDNFKVVQTTYTDAEGNFVFDFENLDSSKAVSGTIYMDHGYDRYGRVTESWDGEFVRVYRVIPGVNQYTAPDEKITAQPWDDYDCGTLTSFVRTFNLEVAVKAEEPLLEQNDIPVQLYYNPNANPTYPIPTKPGLDLNKQVEVNGKDYILLRKDMASEKKEETFQNALSEGALNALETGMGYKASAIPDKTYKFKTTTFKDLVISQSAADYGNFYLLEAGGSSLDRDGNITLKSDYLTYPQNQISDNWDSDFYNYRSRTGMDAQLTKVTRSLEQNILFNSEFDPDRTIRVYLAPDIAEPRIAGRLVDGFTTLGVHTPSGGAKLVVNQIKSRGSYFDDEERAALEEAGEDVKEVLASPDTETTFVRKYDIPTDDYGYFDFKEFTADFNNKEIFSMEPVKLVIHVPGYNDTTIQLPQTIHAGQQIYMDPIVLRPKCAGCYGFVVDEENPDQGIAARVKVLKNGRWVDTYAYSDGATIGGLAGGNYLMGQGILDKTITHAATDLNMGFSGDIDPAFRPILGQNSISNLNENNNTPSLFQGAGAVPGHGPNTSLSGLFDLTGGDGWQNFGSLQVKVDEKGEVKEARIMEAAESGAGMWNGYVDAINGKNSGLGIESRDVSTKVGEIGIAQATNVKQRFDLPMPNKITKIVILPYDRSYIPDTVEVNSSTSENLGIFYMKRRKHKIKVALHMSSDLYEVPVGAIVSIEGVEGEQVVAGDGTAYFEFVNNSTSNFTLRVRPQQPKSVSDGLIVQLDLPPFKFTDHAQDEFGIHPSSSEASVPNTIFVPKTINFSNDDDNVEHIIEVGVDEGGSLSGQVTFKKDGSPVKNALVYLDQGQGLRTDIITVTDEKGNYILAGIPLPEYDGGTVLGELKLGASYSDKVHSYIGEIKSIPYSENPAFVDFQIKEIEDMDLTHLLGMPVRLTEARADGKNRYKVSGEFFDLPQNPNFSVSKNSTGAVLSFDQIPVTASDITNENGIPLAVPVADKIPLDNKIYPVKAFEVYNAKLTAQRSNEQLEMKKMASDTVGMLSGAVRIVDNSFNFPSSYMTISNTDFYLGNFGTQQNGKVDNQEGGNTQSNNQQSDDQQSNLQVLGQQTSAIQNASPQGVVIQGVAGSKTMTGILMPAQRADDKLIIPVFSSEAYTLTKFSLSGIKGNGIHFKYLGFDGTTGNSGVRESYIRGDSVNLYLDLTARIQGGIELNFNAGKAILTHNKMKSISNDDTLHMQIDKWDLMSTSWELSPTSGGIVLKKGILNTGIVGLPFTNMSIIAGDPYGELICNSLDATSLKEAADQGKLVLGGGAAELRLYDGIDIVFAYDPDVGSTPGEGHYKFSLHSLLGKVAYFGGLDGMTDPSQRLDVQFVSTLSNGEQLFAFDGDMKPITLYNQLHFMPQRLFNHEDNFSLGGLISMDVPDMPKNIGMDLRYDNTGEEEIRNELKMSPLDFHFAGNGGSEFEVDPGYKELQRIDKEVVALPGIVTLPNSNQTFKANFVSIVYDGAQDPIPATGKVGLAYNTKRTSGTYAYSSRGGGVQSFRNAGFSNFLLSDKGKLFAFPKESLPEVKIQTEIFVGTSEQLFGDAANALSASLSGMSSYGGGVYDAATGTIGDLSDFSNEIYNEASGKVNDLNTRGRQAYNNLLNQVGSLRLEAHRAYDQVASQIDVLRGHGQEDHEQVYNEILEQLDGLQTQSDELYDEVLGKRDAFLNYGNEVYNEIYGEISGQTEGAQTEAQEMFETLTGEISQKISAFQTYSEGVYGGVTGKANELRSMGDELYDELYNELANTFTNLKNQGEDVRRNVSSIIDDYRDYGIQMYTEASGNIEGLVNQGGEALNQMLEKADELRQQADLAYNKVSAQVESLRAQGKDAYAAAQEEMLAHLNELRTQGDELYNELQTKANEWTQNGQEIINGATDQIEDLEAYKREMYDNLKNELSDKAGEIQGYADNLYSGVEGPINDLRAMGQGVYGEISGKIDEFHSYGEDFYNDVEGVFEGYRDYGKQLYADIYGSVSDKVDEIKASVGGAVAGVKGQIDDVVQSGKALYDELVGGPLEDVRSSVIDEMNGLRNTADQYIGLGGQKVDSILAKWPIAGEAIDAFKGFDGNDVEGSLLRMAGNMVGFEGIKKNLEDKLVLVANETIEGIKKSIEIDNISESASDVMSNDLFKGMNIDFDMNTGRITGSMYTDFISFGAVELSQLGIEILMDRNGWYFYTGAGIDMPASTPLNPIIFPIGVGFLVGNYPTISASLESRVTQHSYVHQLPTSIMHGGIEGFFLTGKKDILRPTSVAINFAIVDFEIGASAGLDARIFANFTNEGTKIGLGVMAFADAYARLSVLGTCGISGAVSANVGIKASYENSAAGSSLSAKACASVAVAGSAWCGWGSAKVSGSFNESIMAMLELCSGSACSQAVTMKIKLGSTCASDNEFDYAN